METVSLTIFLYFVLLADSPESAAGDRGRPRFPNGDRGLIIYHTTKKMVRQQFSDKELNFFKFDSIVKKEFPKALRQTFKLMWDNKYGSAEPWDDSEAVRKSFLAKEGGATKCKSVPTQKSYKKWDCTALAKATIFAQSFAVVDGTGHHQTLNEMYVKPHGLPDGYFHSSVESSGGNKAETFALAIDQLRRLRNEHSHSSSGEMEKITFDQYIQLAKDAFKALGVKTDRLDDLGSLPESELPTKEVAGLRRKNRQLEFVVLFA